jgi:hypothetical protein
MGPEDGSRCAMGLRIAQILLLTAGVLAIPALFFTWLQAYLNIWGQVRIPTPSEISAYEWTAGLSLLIAVVSLAVAIIRRRRGWIVMSVIVLLVIGGTAFVFSVPQARWVPSSAPVPVDRQPHPPCYSGSNDCVGG